MSLSIISFICVTVLAHFYFIDGPKDSYEISKLKFPMNRLSLMH